MERPLAGPGIRGTSARPRAVPTASNGPLPRRPRTKRTTIRTSARRIGRTKRGVARRIQPPPPCSDPADGGARSRRRPGGSASIESQFARGEPSETARCPMHRREPRCSYTTRAAPPPMEPTAGGRGPGVREPPGSPAPRREASGGRHGRGEGGREGGGVDWSSAPRTEPGTTGPARRETAAREDGGPSNGPQGKAGPLREGAGPSPRASPPRRWTPRPSGTSGTRRPPGPRKKPALPRAPLRRTRTPREAGRGDPARTGAPEKESTPERAGPRVLQPSRPDSPRRSHKKAST